MFFENYSIYMYTACNIPVNFVLARFKFHKKQKMNGKKNIIVCFKFRHYKNIHSVNKDEFDCLIRFNM